MKRKFTIVLNFTHELVTRCWAIMLLATYWFHQVSRGKVELQFALGGLKREFFYVGLTSAVVTLFTGMGSALIYMGIEDIFSDYIEKQRRKSVLIIYVILLSLLIFRIFWWYKVSGGSQLIGGMKREFLFPGFICAAVLILIELGDTFLSTYMRDLYEDNPEKFLRRRRNRWIVMHIILLSVISLGTYWHYTLVFK